MARSRTGRRSGRAVLAGAAFAVAACCLAVPRDGATWVAGPSPPARSSAAAAHSDKKEEEVTAETRSRRSILGREGSALAALASVLLGADNSRADWGVRNLMPTDPPVPSDNDFIRSLQKKSWELEPVFRTRLYLKAVKQKLSMAGELGLFNYKYFVRYPNEPYKFDILDEPNYKEAVKSGKVFEDSVYSNPGDEVAVFLYKSPADQEWVYTNLQVCDKVVLPDELIANIEEVKRRKFNPDGLYAKKATAETTPAATTPAA